MPDEMDIFPQKVVGEEDVYIEGAPPENSAPPRKPVDKAAKRKEVADKLRKRKLSKTQPNQTDTRPPALEGVDDTEADEKAEAEVEDASTQSTELEKAAASSGKSLNEVLDLPTEQETQDLLQLVSRLGDDDTPELEDLLKLFGEPIKLTWKVKGFGEVEGLYDELYLADNDEGGDPRKLCLKVHESRGSFIPVFGKEVMIVVENDGERQEFEVIRSRDRFTDVLGYINLTLILKVSMLAEQRKSAVEGEGQTFNSEGPSVL